MTTLVELIKQNNNYDEKGGGGHGTDKESLHQYCSLVYDRLMAPYQDKKINFLEIGTSHGGSVLMWNDYFPNATIYTVDIDNKSLNALDNYPRIKKYLTNAYDPEFAKTLPDFDIMLDDGPHLLESFIQFIKIYLPKLKPGGMLLIEDIGDIDYTRNMINLIGDLKYEVIDTRHVNNRFDNINFVVYK
jgi:cephalosporin hydroxylase